MKVNSVINAVLNGYDSTKEKEKISSKAVFPSKVALERDNDVRVEKKKTLKPESHSKVSLT